MSQGSMRFARRQFHAAATAGSSVCDTGGYANFRRIPYESRDNSEHWILHRLGEALDSARREASWCCQTAGEAFNDRMLALDATVVRVAYGADSISGFC